MPYKPTPHNTPHNSHSPHPGQDLLDHLHSTLPAAHLEHNSSLAGRHNILPAAAARGFADLGVGHSSRLDFVEGTGILADLNC